jgi:chromosome segregation ATPase
VNLLLDGSFGRSVCEVLNGLGHDVESAALSLAAPMSDEELVARAVETGRALVTLDEHFANPLRFDPSRTGGIIIVSLPDERSPEAGAPVDRILELKSNVLRTLADVAQELDELEREIRAADDETARLRESAADALAARVTEGAKELEAALRAAEARRTSLAAARDGVRAARDQGGRLVQGLTSRYYEVLVTRAVDRAPSC